MVIILDYSIHNSPLIDWKFYLFSPIILNISIPLLPCRKVLKSRWPDLEVHASKDGNRLSAGHGSEKLKSSHPVESEIVLGNKHRAVFKVMAGLSGDDMSWISWEFGIDGLD